MKSSTATNSSFSAKLLLGTKVQWISELSHNQWLCCAGWNGFSRDFHRCRQYPMDLLSSTIAFALKQDQHFGADVPYQRVGFKIPKWHTHIQKSGKSPPPPREYGTTWKKIVPQQVIRRLARFFSESISIRKFNHGPQMSNRITISDIVISKNCDHVTFSVYCWNQKL